MKVFVLIRLWHTVCDFNKKTNSFKYFFSRNLLKLSNPILLRKIKIGDIINIILNKLLQENFQFFSDSDLQEINFKETLKRRALTFQALVTSVYSFWTTKILFWRNSRIWQIGLVCKASSAASHQTRWHIKRISIKGYPIPRDVSWI